MAEFEKHLTIEQLSAFLDRELSVSEQESVEQHLTLCEHCQHRFAELRLTAQLLHSLPQPALPRSFVLSLDTIAADPVPARITPFIRTTKVQHPTPLSAYLRPLRTLSTLAAVFGIVFLLSAILPLFLFSSGGSASSSVSEGSAAIPVAKAPENGFDHEQLTQLAINPHAIEKPSIATRIPSTPPPVYQPSQPDTHPVDTSPPIIFSLFDLSTSQGRATLGFLLLLLGILGLIFFRRSRWA